MRTRHLLTLALIASIALPAGMAVAHKGATGIVKQRMDAMKAVADATKTVAQMVKGQTAFDANLAASAAEEIKGHASNMADLFPQDSLDHPSEALPAIWKDWAKFTEIAGQLTAASAELAATATSANEAAELRPVFGKVAATCSACHEKFRLPQ